MNAFAEEAIADLPDFKAPVLLSGSEPVRVSEPSVAAATVAYAGTRVRLCPAATARL